MLWDWLPWFGRKHIADRVAWYLTEMEDNPERHRAERERWLAGGSRRRRMYDETLRRLHAEGWGAGLERPPVVEPAPLGSPNWRGLVPAVAGACALLVLAGSLALEHLRMPASSSSSQQIAALQEFSTLAGQHKSVRLADKSLVTLGPDTDLAVALRPDQRTLGLRKGTARFSVAHDTGRPFVVWAGGGTTTATGTLFDVSLRPDRTVHVNLIQGSVVVTSPATSGKRTNPTRKLTAGEHAIYAAMPATPDRPEMAEGSIHFEYDNLDTVVARLNRYSPATIELADPSLAHLRVYGDCDLHDVGRFVQMIALSLNLDAVENPGRIVLRAKDGTIEK